MNVTIPGSSWKLKTRMALAIAAAAAAAGIILLLVWQHDQPTHRFGVVEDGVLYRGSQPDAAAMDTIIGKYGIKTVVNLRGLRPQEDWWRAERDGCSRRGVRMVDVSMSDSDTALPGLVQFLDLASDPSNHPIFVHCEAGSARTGYSVAAYRIAMQGWSYEKALQEAMTYRFKPEVNLNPQYGRILHELAANRDWRKLGSSAASAPTSAPVGSGE